MSYENLREEEVKNKVAKEYFTDFDGTKIIGNVDFCITVPNNNQTELFDTESLLWAEAKKGKSDIYKSIVQLILTIGKARTFDKFLPPAYLGAFDAEKIGFIPYNTISDIFYVNDFNWTVTPSNHETKEFLLVLDKVRIIIDHYSLLFHFDKDQKEIKEFIKTNFIVGKSETSKIKIDKNNFMIVYNKWLTSVRPTIEANWDKLKNAKKSIIDGDFYLADLISNENVSFKVSLSVVLNSDIYRTNKEHNDYGGLDFTEFGFNDNQKAHRQFWNKYERPPNKLYWDYMVLRRDLLVPQDVRERKGSFFTPQIWVEKSRTYLAEVLGMDWQEEYTIWDCAAGTGNLLSGLSVRHNIYASTLDRQDVDVLHDRIETMNKNSTNGQGSNLLHDHVFQFDFLNDSFDKLPQTLQNIIADPEKRKKLLIYINPPYAEHGNMSAIYDKEKEAKTGVAKQSKVYNDFKSIVGTATRELYAQFFLRIYKDIPDVKLASFSTLKFVNSQNFLKFRQYFNAEYKKGFICKANSFDNVKGKFPIGFLIWDLSNKIPISKVNTDVFENEYISIENKSFYSFGSKDFISGWLRKYYDNQNPIIGYLILPGVDMQCQNGVYITAQPTESDIKQHKLAKISGCNLIIMSIYLAVRKCIKPNWTNNRDQFLHPNENWKLDNEFQNDCLAYTLFSNNIQSKYGNNWIPFTENEVNARTKFDSNFMTDFIDGKTDKLEMICEPSLFEINENRTTKLEFSDEAQTVFNSGRELYKYYHKQKDCNVNASLYDIKEYFQGRKENGKMNPKSQNETYNKLIKDLRKALEVLEIKLQPKVYEFGFLKE
jgi:hypothetical protein